MSTALLEIAAMAVAVGLTYLMTLCAFAGKPVKDELDEIQREDSR